MNMELHVPRRFPLAAMFFAVIAIVSLIAGITSSNPHLRIFAAAPGLLAAGLFFGHRREFLARLTDEGLIVERPAITIPFKEMENITFDGRGIAPSKVRRERGTVIVMHRNGLLEIPASRNIPGREVYRMLIERVSTPTDSALSSKIMDYYEAEVKNFGAERVFAFSRRNVLGRSVSTFRAQLCAGLLLLCGIYWCIVYATTPRHMQESYEPWMGFGITLSLFSILFWSLFNIRQRGDYTAMKKIKNAELVISPTGIALKQDAIEGHLRWDELTSVQFSPGVRFSSKQSVDFISGIQLCMAAGLHVTIGDLYNRPLPIIQQTIERYWKKG